MTSCLTGLPHHVVGVGGGAGGAVSSNWELENLFFPKWLLLGILYHGGIEENRHRVRVKQTLPVNLVVIWTEQS